MTTAAPADLVANSANSANSASRQPLTAAWWARRLDGLLALPTTDAAATLAGRTLRTALLALPARVRHSPVQREAFDRVGSDPRTP